MTDNNRSAKYCFISYAHANKNIVVPIANQLREGGYRVWYDANINPGSEWDEAVAEKIRSCYIFIAFITKEFLASENCVDELKYARDHVIHSKNSNERNIVLIYFENVERPTWLDLRFSRYQAILGYDFASDKSVVYDKLSEIREIEKTKYQMEEIQTDEYTTVSLNQSAKVGEFVTFGHCEQGLRGEELPIVWEIIDKKENELVLLSKDILFSKPFHNENEEVEWKDSDLRAWLNQFFYKNAFSESEKEKMCSASILTGGNEDASGLDRVVIPSLEELYYYPQIVRQKKGTAHVIKDRLWVSPLNTYSPWWLNTSGELANSKMILNTKGEVCEDGDPVFCDSRGVVPLIRVKCEA